MTEVPNNLFESGIALPAESTWLDKKVQRREVSEDINRAVLSDRKEKANKAAESFLYDMSRKAQLRNGIESKSMEVRRREEEVLKRKADEYRERLRRFLPPELRTDG